MPMSDRRPSRRLLLHLGSAARDWQCVSLRCGKLYCNMQPPSHLHSEPVPTQVGPVSQRPSLRALAQWPGDDCWKIFTLRSVK